MEKFEKKLLILEKKAKENPIDSLKTCISIYIPKNVPITAVLKQLLDEANRIKTSAITLNHKKVLTLLLFSIEKHLKENYKKSPNQGMAIFCLPTQKAVPASYENQKFSKIEVLIPPKTWKPIENFLYVCDWTFYLDYFEQ